MSKKKHLKTKDLAIHQDIGHSLRQECLEISWLENKSHWNELLSHIGDRNGHLEILEAEVELVRGWRGQEKEREVAAGDQKAFSFPPPLFFVSLAWLTLPL